MLLQVTTQAPVQTVPVQTQVVRPSFTDTLIGSFRDAFSMILSAIPRILGFIVVVAIGWFVSTLLARGVTSLLRAIHFDEWMQRSGIADFFNKMGTGTIRLESLPESSSGSCVSWFCWWASMCSACRPSPT